MVTRMNHVQRSQTWLVSKSLYRERRFLRIVRKIAKEYLIWPDFSSLQHQQQLWTRCVRADSSGAVLRIINVSGVQNASKLGICSASRSRFFRFTRPITIGPVGSSPDFMKSKYRCAALEHTCSSRRGTQKHRWAGRALLQNETGTMEA